MSVFSESPYSVKDYPFIISTILPFGYTVRLSKNAKNEPNNDIKPYVSRGNIWMEYNLPNISTELLNKRISDGERVLKESKASDTLSSAIAYNVFYYKKLNITKLDYSKISDDLKSKVSVLRVYKEGWVDFKFKIQKANNEAQKVKIYDAYGGYIPSSEEGYLLVRGEFDTNTNKGLLSYYNDIVYINYAQSTDSGYSRFDTLIWNYYPKQIEPFKDPAPSLPGPNTSTVSGLAPTPPKADALVASAKSALPTPPALPSIPSTPSIPSAPSLPSVGSIPSTPSLSSVTSGVGNIAGRATSGIGSSVGGLIGGVAGGAVGGLVGGVGVGGNIGNTVGGALGSATGNIAGGLVGSATSAVSGVASSVTSAAKSALSSVSKWKPFHFSAASTVKAKIDASTGNITSLASGKISSITSQAPAVSLPSIPSSGISIPSVSLASAPSVSIPSSAIPSGIPTLPSSPVSLNVPNPSSALSSATSGLTNVANSPASSLGSAVSGLKSKAKNLAASGLDKIKGGVNRIQTIKIPKKPSAADVNSKFSNLV